jgi:hypothetical protein
VIEPVGVEPRMPSTVLPTTGTEETTESTAEVTGVTMEPRSPVLLAPPRRDPDGGGACSAEAGAD